MVSLEGSAIKCVRMRLPEGMQILANTGELLCFFGRGVASLLPRLRTHAMASVGCSCFGTSGSDGREREGWHPGGHPGGAGARQCICRGATTPNWSSRPSSHTPPLQPSESSDSTGDSTAQSGHLQEAASARDSSWAAWAARAAKAAAKQSHLRPVEPWPQPQPGACTWQPRQRWQCWPSWWSRWWHQRQQSRRGAAAAAGPNATVEAHC